MKLRLSLLAAAICILAAGCSKFDGNDFADTHWTGEFISSDFEDGVKNEVSFEFFDGKADFVNGSRYMNGPEENTPAYRRVGQKVLDIATNISAGIHITDSQSGFRAFSPKAKNVFRFKDTGFGIESEMLVDAAEAGLKIVEVPITVRYDLDGSTKDPITHGVGVLFNIAKDKVFRTFKK